MWLTNVQDEVVCCICGEQSAYLKLRKFKISQSEKPLSPMKGSAVEEFKSGLVFLFSMHTSGSAADEGFVERFQAYMDDAPCWNHSLLMKPSLGEV